MMRLFFFDDAQHGIDQKQKQNPARGQLRQLQQRAVGTRARSKRPRAHTDACLVNTHTHTKKNAHSLAAKTSLEVGRASSLVSELVS